MSETIENLEAYYQRKKDRRDDYARNMELALDMRNLDQAQNYLLRSNVLTEVMDTIEHCILIVRRSEEHSS